MLKKKNGEGQGREGIVWFADKRFLLLSSPSPYLPFFALVPSFRAITRSETLATHARSEQLAFTVLPTAVDFGPVKDLFPLGLSGTVRDICCSPDGRWIALGFSSGLTSVLDTRGGLLRSHRRAHTSEIYQVQLKQTCTEKQMLFISTGNQGYLLFTWKNWKIRLESQMSRAILSGKLQKTRALVLGETIFLLSSANLDTLYSGSFSHQTKFYNFMFIQWGSLVIGKSRSSLCWWVSIQSIVGNHGFTNNPTQ